MRISRRRRVRTVRCDWRNRDRARKVSGLLKLALALTNSQARSLARKARGGPTERDRARKTMSLLNQALAVAGKQARSLARQDWP